MAEKYKVLKTIEINADKSKVWDAIINPEIIKQYFFGTEVVSDWEVGSEIIFQGEYQGTKYRDKGNILKIESEKILQYNYWSWFSGLEDKEENYSIVTYELNDENGKTRLSLTQENFANEQSKEHSDKNWNIILNQMKEIIEK